MNEILMHLDPIVFEEPRTVDWSANAWVGHIPFAFYIMSVHKPRIFVELGVHSGNSYNAFCQGADMLGLNTKCYGVDTWTGDDHAGHYDDSVYSKLAAYHKKLYDNFSKLLKMTFDEALQHFEDGSVDLLHIDGCHRYEEVRHDFESWFPKMSDRGIILFHDTEVRKGDFGVYRLWKELTPKYPHYNFTHSHGLGVLAVGKQASSVKHLTEHEGEIAQHFFSTSGERFSNRMLRFDLEDQLLKINQSKTDMENDLLAQLNEYRERDEQKEEEIKRLGEKLNSYDVSIEKLSGEILDLKLGLQATNEKLAEEERRTQDLQSALSQKESELADQDLLYSQMTKKHGELQDQYDSLLSRYNEKEEQEKNARANLAAKDVHIANLERDNHDLRKSISFRLGWWLTRPGALLVLIWNDLILFSRLLPVFPSLVRGLFKNSVSFLKHFNRSNILKMRRALASEPIDLVLKNYLRFLKHPERSSFSQDYLSIQEQYKRFLEINKLNPDQISSMKNEANNFGYQPLISIITPVYNTDPRHLERCILSVLSQYYYKWELCLHDDCSTSRETQNVLKRWERRDSRIKVSFGKVNEHISMASNRAIESASGEFVGLLDHDDELTPDALYQVVKVLNENDDWDFIYSDEDKLDKEGNLCDPHFKSDFNYDLLLSHNYICHFSVIRKTVGDQIGWFREGYEGSQDYDLFLRTIDLTKKIYHIPRVLYHWRKVEGSTAASLEQKDYAIEAGRKALQDYLVRNQIDASVENGLFPNSFDIRYKLMLRANVSIIIPFRDALEVLKVCIESIFNTTSYDNFEVILINNRSQSDETLDYLDFITERYDNIRLLHFDGEFNYSRINNFGVEMAKGDYLLFLNNDIEVLESGWLFTMVTHLQRDNVGAVGVKLLYPNGKVQHAGVATGLLTLAGHLHRYLDGNHPGYFGRASVTQNLSACTGACLMVKRKVFMEVGGFEEEGLPIAFNDIDLCLKIRAQGYLIVFNPHCRLIHHESYSRGKDDVPARRSKFIQEVDFFHQKWLKVLDRCDPYYNPNLTHVAEDLSLNIDPSMPISKNNA